ncbi:MAG: hypothetical protein ACK5Q5_14590 [Planctomycetaceae bacterium]
MTDEERTADQPRLYTEDEFSRVMEVVRRQQARINELEGSKSTADPQQIAAINDRVKGVLERLSTEHVLPQLKVESGSGWVITA